MAIEAIQGEEAATERGQRYVISGFVYKAEN